MKEFFTYDQQLEKLTKDGLIINDREEVLTVLKNAGYYNVIAGYSPFYKDKDNKKYLKNVSFDNIKSLYDFDNRLKQAIYNYASKIENIIKTRVVHVFSERYGVDEKIYLTPACFTDDKSKQDSVRDNITRCNRVISKGLDKSSSKYKEYLFYTNNKHGHIPLWVLARSLTFGCISKFYDVMKDDDKENVAASLSINKDILSNILNLIVQFRNIVAHGERTFCTKLPKHSLSSRLNIFDIIQIQRNTKGDPLYGKRDLMALIIAFKYLLSPMDFTNFWYEFTSYLDEYVKQNNNLPEVISRVKKEMGLVGSWRQVDKIKI